MSAADGCCASLLYSKIPTGGEVMEREQLERLLSGGDDTSSAALSALRAGATYVRRLGRNADSRVARDYLRAPTPSHPAEGHRDLRPGTGRATPRPIWSTGSPGPDQGRRRILDLHAVPRRGRQHAGGVHRRPAGPTGLTTTRRPLKLWTANTLSNCGGAVLGCVQGRSPGFMGGSLVGSSRLVVSPERP